MNLKNFLTIVAVTFIIVARPALAAQLPDFTDLIEKNSPAVVKINTVQMVLGSKALPFPYHQEIPDFLREYFDKRLIPDHQSQAIGSGFIISRDGYVLTNHHVVEGADEITVRLIDRREFVAKVIGADRRSDLALLKIEAADLPSVEFVRDSGVRVGEWVVAIGSPFGLDYSVSAGIVSAIGRSLPTEKGENYVPFIQTDVAINPGHSGGPLFNLRGKVVGINSQIYTRSGGSIGLSFAIPTDVALKVVEQLKKKGRVDRGWLGVLIQDIDANLAETLGLEKPQGALIAQVESGSPADKAGIQPGDVIIEFNGEPIMESSDLPHVVGMTTPGSDVGVELVREQHRKSLQITVGTLAQGDADTDTAARSMEGDRLGLEIDELDDDTRKELNVRGGVIVKQIYPNSPAVLAGIRSGDVIVQLGNKSILSVEDYKRVREDLLVDTPILIRFYHRGQPVFRTIELKK